MQVLRWWDGARWGPQTQPLPPATPAGQEADGRHRGAPAADGVGAPWSAAGPALPASGALAPGGIFAPQSRAPAPWAWIIAGTPLIAIAIATVARTYVSPHDDGNCVAAGWAIAGLISLLAASQDVKALVRRDDLSNSGFAWLSLLSLIGGWIYLWVRAVKRLRRTNADWALLGIGAAAWVVAVIVSVPLAGSTVNSGITQSYLQSQISQGIKAKTGDASTVSCPQDPPVSPGSTFECLATFSDQTTDTVKVTIQDANGDWLWQVVNS
jgi:hypothetical protein